MERQASPEQRRDLRLRLASRQIPEVLLWAGVLTLVFGVVNYLTLPGESAWSWATNLVFGPLFVLLAVGAPARRHPRESRPRRLGLLQPPARRDAGDRLP